LLFAVLPCREGKFHVLPEEPEFSSSATGSRSHPAVAAAAGLQDSSSQLLLCHSELSELSDSEMMSAAQFTAAQLDCLKAQLEALLPATPAELSDEDC
jgi:hypothetical protein